MIHAVAKLLAVQHASNDSPRSSHPTLGVVLLTHLCLIALCSYKQRTSCRVKPSIRLLDPMRTMSRRQAALQSVPDPRQQMANPPHLPRAPGQSPSQPANDRCITHHYMPSVEI